ncbi:MAG: peptidase S24 [Proteobacteria bacterium]|nr:peptidase S24 [Pseudomonadota bacterium]
MNQRSLHPAQSLLLKLLSSHADDPLTIRELQERIGASSTSVVAHHLQQLEKKGYLKRNAYNSRDYQVLESQPESDVTLVNLYGMATCGPHGSLLEGDPVDRIPLASRLLSFPAAEAFMLKAKGKSMEPKIYEGDLIIARKTNKCDDGKVYVCVNDEECLVKMVRRVADRILLESFNRQIPIFEAAPDFRVEGEVKSIISGKI